MTRTNAAATTTTSYAADPTAAPCAALPVAAGCAAATALASALPAQTEPARATGPTVPAGPAAASGPAVTSGGSWSSVPALGLAGDYRQARKDAGKQGVTDAKVVAKFLFWLCTGRLPERASRGAFAYDDLRVIPGWQPVPVTSVSARHIEDYRIVLTGAVSRDSAGRDLDVLAGFYAWLLGTDDTPVAAHRQARTRRPSRRGSGHTSDRFYTAAQTAAMLTVSAQRVLAARQALSGSRAASRLRKHEVEHVIAWLLWGTGASAQHLCQLDVTDLDLRAGTIRWQDRRDTPLAGGRGDVVFVQPIPAALVHELRHYLSSVRPRLGLTGRRLLGNPDGHSGADSQRGEQMDVKVVSRATTSLAQQAGLAGLGGKHNPRRWGVSYGMRVLESERGTMIALLRLNAVRAYVSLERSYGALQPQQPEMSINEVFPQDPPTDTGGSPPP